MGERSESSVLGRLVELLTVVGEPVGNVLVYSSAYLAFITMAEVAIVMTLLSLPPSLAPVVGGLVTFAIYANDRIEDLETDAVTNPRQAAFVSSHKDTLYVLASISYGLAVALSVLGGPLALGLTLLPGVFWVLYATEWIPDLGVQIRRLKEVFLVNSVVVALAWAISLTFLPLAFVDAAVTPTAVVVFAYFLLRSFVDTEIPNVSDVEGDRAIGVKTLPVVLGVPRTKQALAGIDLLTVAVVSYAAHTDLLPIGVAGVLVVGIAYSLVVTSLLGRADDDLLSVAAEFEYVLVGLLLVPVVYGL